MDGTQLESSSHNAVYAVQDLKYQEVYPHILDGFHYLSDYSQSEVKKLNGEVYFDGSYVSIACPICKETTSHRVDGKNKLVRYNKVINKAPIKGTLLKGLAQRFVKHFDSVHQSNKQKESNLPIKVILKNVDNESVYKGKENEDHILSVPPAKKIKLTIGSPATFRCKGAIQSDRHNIK